MDLSESELKVLKMIDDRKDVPEYTLIEDGESPETIRSAVSWLEKKGLISVNYDERNEYIPSEEALIYSQKGFPEERAVSLLKKNGKISLIDLRRELGDADSKIAISQLAKMGLKPDNGMMIYGNREDIDELISKRRKILEEIISGKDVENSLNSELQNLLKRSGLIEKRQRKFRLLTLTESGKKAIGDQDGSATIGEITPEMIASGEFRNHKFRAYDLNLPGEKKERNGYHPLTLLIDEIRGIFSSLGFTEVRDDYIEYTGWNMDALFIPQNHSARDMQDTFYIERKNREEPDPELLKLFERAGKIQREGTEGHKGWGFEWSINEATKTVLRTHTTASSMRALWKEPDIEKAVFSVDRVFRHESVDWKHLAEFHQVEGAIYSRDANLQTLIWVMKKFYGSLGFKSIELVPSYYPYTEPSMDVIVNIDGKEVEMGGSGVIRQEVREILGLKYPVVAWGLGLERLAMLYNELKDIRGIYNSDLGWLRNYKIRV
ncbi:phenylalanine--tRNA ligase subunit alpha [Cuniculiplasma sp. SKW3]|uniref:phenylalanine--tRNA ligase subunit alpha n=1 Tax=unclassified Cuniculiplasma TaxID=2619706 RepID=UPI003FD4B81F